jgi:hypothetical protein
MLRVASDEKVPFRAARRISAAEERLVSLGERDWI